MFEVCQPADTTSVNSNLLKCLSSYSDSVSQIPAYEMYCQWDTTVIHPYHFEANVFKDTVNLILTGDYSSAFVMPRIGRTNSGFGARHRQPHFGVDIHLVTGDTVLSAFDGLVRIAKLNSSYGNVVIIRHKNGLETIYAHLSKILVHTDQYVNAGELIGLGGNTGHSFGSHLHFEVRYKGEPLDPNELISFDEQRLVGDTVMITSKSFEFYESFLGGKYYVMHKNSRNMITSGKKNSKQFVAGSKGKAGYYTVRKGDTIYSIARRYGKTPDQICKLNHMRASAVLHIGAVIRWG